MKAFKNPVAEDYDRYRLKLDDRAVGILCDWCDVVGYVTFDDIAKKAAGAKRARGVTTGSRVIHLEHHAAYDAKSRLPLPSVIDLDMEHPWRPFALAVDAVHLGTPDALRAEIDVELARLGATFTRADGKEMDAAVIVAAVESAGDDASTLSKYLVNLKQSNPKEIQS